MNSFLLEVTGGVAAGAELADNLPWCTVLGVILKILAETGEIAFETIVLHRNVVKKEDRLRSKLLDERSNISTKSPRAVSPDVAKYEAAADAYIVFYTLGLLAIIIYWAIHYYLKKRPSCAATLIALTCEMPLMVCEISMLKAGGVITWDDQLADLILQMLFLVNVFIQMCFDMYDILRYLELREIGICVVCAPCALAIIFVLTTILYAPVCWAMAGWHWFQRIHVRHLGGIVVSKDAENVLEILLLFGHIGQWVLSALIICTVLYCLYRLCKSKKCNCL